MKTKDIKIANTYPVKIYGGLREGYGNIVHDIQEVYDLCQKYCDDVGLCVTITPTVYIYQHGGEGGVVIGLINYPRFPTDKERILEHAFNLATEYAKRFGQVRVSIETPDKTYTVKRFEEEAKEDI